MYVHPRSNSYQRDDSFADVPYAWWLLWSSSPPIRMPHGTMFFDASADAKLR